MGKGRDVVANRALTNSLLADEDVWAYKARAYGYLLEPIGWTEGLFAEPPLRDDIVEAFQRRSLGYDLHTGLHMENSFSLRGALVLFTLKMWNDYDKMQAILTRYGRTGAIPRRPKMARLRAVIEQRWPGMLVRPVSGDSVPGFEVLKESRGEVKNTYEHLFTLGLEEARSDSPRVVYVSDPHNTEVQTSTSALQEWFDRSNDVVHQSTLANEIVRVLSQRWQALTLRRAGGCYWVPDAFLTDLEAFAKEMKDNGNDIYVFRHAPTEESVAAVIETFHKEIQKELADLATKETPRARSNMADRLRKRIRDYEVHLKVGLESLVEDVTKVEDELLAATLEDSLQSQGSLFAGTTCNGGTP